MPEDQGSAALFENDAHRIPYPNVTTRREGRWPIYLMHNVPASHLSMDFYDLAIVLLEATRDHAVLAMVFGFLRRR